MVIMTMPIIIIHHIDNMITMAMQVNSADDLVMLLRDGVVLCQVPLFQSQSF